MKKDDHFKNQFWVGPNYWPAHAGIRMWSDWRPDLILSELKDMCDLGFNVNRSFLFMPDFVPTAERVEPEMLARFTEFLSLNELAGIRTIPSFFVGHMSGEDWDVNWRQGRNIYTDPRLLPIQKMYIQQVVKSAAGSEAIAGWIATNEIFNYEPDGTPNEIAAWGAAIVNYVKEIDSTHPVSLGEGARGPETNRRLANFQTRKYVPFIDFIGLHYYPRPGNHWHQSFTTAYRINISQFWNKPVIVEEFGHSTTMGSEKNQAEYYRTVLYSALINGAVGTMNWCYSDFDLHSERPYVHHPFELRFGIRKTNGSLRSAGKVMSEFAGLAKELSDDNWVRQSESEIGVIIPSNYYYEYPHDYDTKFPHWYPLYLEVFSQLKRCNLHPRSLLEPAIELEKDGRLSHELVLDPSKNPVLILPRMKRITAVFWERLQQYVYEGGTLYASFAQDHWIPDWEEFFGLKSDLKFGIPAVRNWNQLQITPTKTWGGFEVGKNYSLEFKQSDLDYAFCPIINIDGEVLLKDQIDHPILISKSYGKGRIYYSVYPLEIISLGAANGGGDKVLQLLYKSIWKMHGRVAEIIVNGKDLEYGTWRNDETENLKIVVLNHAGEERKGTVELPLGYSIDRFTPELKENKPKQIDFFLHGNSVLIIDALNKDGIDLNVKIDIRKGEYV
ncbi:MAG: hypothetical protein HQ562_05305 [Candidatus Marinimicrobia bacterium]|nr:hypothetical protein [Candidatus Neomarinimicrobiota bacterium]